MRIKSLIITAILATVVLFSTTAIVLASGLTSAQVQAIIGLLQSFGADATTIANVQTSLTGTAPLASAPNAQLQPQQNVSIIKSSAGNMTDISSKIKSLTDDIFELNKEINGLKLQSVKNSKLANLSEITEERKELVKELMAKDPKDFLSIAITKTQLSSLPLSIQKNIEKEATISAKIEVSSIDDFNKPENSRYEYFLNVGGKKLSFYPVQKIDLLSDTTVKVKGYQLDEVVVSDVSKENFQILAVAPPLDSIGEQKTLVLLVDFQDSGEKIFTEEQAYNFVFGADSNFQKFYKENSYGKVSFTGDIYGWYTLQRNAYDTRGYYGCQFPSDGNSAAIGQGNEIDDMLTQNNIDLSKYNRLVIITRTFSNEVTQHNCFIGYQGMSSIGKISGTFNGKPYKLSVSRVAVDYHQLYQATYIYLFKFNDSDRVLIHEVGHGLGLMHAKGWACDNQALYGNCGEVEYGNYFDLMGFGIQAFHFNAFYKDFLGWLDSSSVSTIIKSGRYTLNPLEANSGIKLVKIQQPGSTKTLFSLEYRQAIGYDSTLNLYNPYPSPVLPSYPYISNQNGLMVNEVIDSGTDYPYTLLLDMSPGPMAWTQGMNGLKPANWGQNTYEATLNGNNIFNDPQNGITIGPIISNDNSQITFDVNIVQPNTIPCHDQNVIIPSPVILDSIKTIYWSQAGDNCPANGGASLWLGDETTQVSHPISYSATPTASGNNNWTYTWNVNSLADNTTPITGHSFHVSACPAGATDNSGCSDSVSFTISGITCKSNSDCGIDTYTGSPFCKGDNNVYQGYISYVCNNPGTAQSSCITSSITFKLKTICANNQTCSNGSCITSQAVNGLCGSANNVATSTPPTSNLCSAGTASQVWASINPTTYVWSCQGTNGGTTASCSAPGITTSAPPAAITDLRLSNPTTSSVTLTWTAPGANGATGTATTYVLKYQTGTVLNWSTATQLVNPIMPAPTGTTQTYTVTGLSPNTTYVFGINAANENWQFGNVTQTPSIATLALSASCGTANGATFADLTSLSAANLCGSGSVVSRSPLPTSSGWAWYCGLTTTDFSAYCKATQGTPSLNASQNDLASIITAFLKNLLNLLGH